MAQYPRADPAPIAVQVARRGKKYAVLVDGRRIELNPLSGFGMCDGLVLSSDGALYHWRVITRFE